MRSLVLLFVACLVFEVADSSPTAAGAVRISQIYPRGATGTSSYDADYVELFNVSATVADIGGWVLAYGGSNPTSVYGCAGCTNSIPAGTTIAPCGYLLVRLGPVQPALAPTLPPVDLSFPTPDMGSTGSLALLTGGVPSGLCLSGATLQDLVGWGSASCFAGQQGAPAVDATHALLRLGEGTLQTGQNSSDFVLGSPTPRNSSSPKSQVCTTSPAASTSWGLLKVLYR